MHKHHLTTNPAIYRCTITTTILCFPTAAATKPAKFALTRKWAGPVMPKGQLSKVPWPGSCRRLFTFQAVLRPLQQTHKHSCSLHLAIHTKIALPYCSPARLFVASNSEEAHGPGNDMLRERNLSKKEAHGSRWTCNPLSYIWNLQCKARRCHESLS